MSRSPSELVQAVAVRPAGHLDTCAAVAAASGLALLRSDPLDPRWVAWLEGRFTKSVRRVSRQAQWDRLVAVAEGLGIEVSTASSGEAVAMAFPPMAYEAMPRELRSLQVSGLDADRSLPQSGPVPRADPAARLLVPLVRLSPSAAMSTGKASAQAAHAVCLWLLLSGEHVRDRWLRRPVVRVEEAEEARDAVIAVRDAGLTEVEPGTVTATVQAPAGAAIPSESEEDK